jgi:hypothetical protein
MSLETAIQQLTDAVTREIASLEARVAAAPTVIPRAQEVAAAVAKAMPAGGGDLKAGTTGYVLRVGRTHALVSELHVAVTHSGHISIAFRASRFGKPQPDEHWELLDPTTAEVESGEAWTRVLQKFCDRTVALSPA